MSRLSLVAAAAALAFAASLASAETSAEQKPKAKAAKPAAASQSRKELQSQAKGLALATETVETITEAQLELAARVNTGKADCEFNQSVEVEAIEGKPGFFKVGYKGAHYLMVPEPTTTGAIRLEDKKAGVVWLQIPSKSMLMNSKIGQRMVDACLHPVQRSALADTGTAVR